ncbi:hypothetical protein [Pseudomonas nitroreducens]
MAHTHRNILLLSGMLLMGFASLGPEIIESSLKSEYRNNAKDAEKCLEQRDDCKRRGELALDEKKSFFVTLISMSFGGIGCGLVAGACSIKSTRESREEEKALITGWIKKAESPAGLFSLLVFSCLFVTSIVNQTNDDQYQNRELIKVLWLSSLGIALCLARHILRNNDSLFITLLKLLNVSITALIILLIQDPLKVIPSFPLAALITSSAIVAIIFRKKVEAW